MSAAPASIWPRRAARTSFGDAYALYPAWAGQPRRRPLAARRRTPGARPRRRRAPDAGRRKRAAASSGTGRRSRSRRWPSCARTTGATFQQLAQVARRTPRRRRCGDPRASAAGRPPAALAVAAASSLQTCTTERGQLRRGDSRPPGSRNGVAASKKRTSSGAGPADERARSRPRWSRRQSIALTRSDCRTRSATRGNGDERDGRHHQPGRHGLGYRRAAGVERRTRRGRAGCPQRADQIAGGAGWPRRRRQRRAAGLRSDAHPVGDGAVRG